MGIQRLTAKDNILVKQCDELFIKFLDSEGKYDENYLKRENVKSFLNDLEDENNILLVKKDLDKVIGFLYGYIQKTKGSKEAVAHIAFVYVEEDSRNNKIATSLIDEFLKYLKSINIKYVEVKCYEENIAAKKLYEKYDFNSIWSNYRKRI